MKPLEIKVQQAGTTESNSENIRSALARNLPELVPAPCSHDGTFVIVGSGPSVVNHLDDIKREQELGRPICAIKGTHDWLLENGVTPNLFVSVEPRLRPVKPSQNTVYLLASRCSPELFDSLEGYKVLLWHSWSMEPECEVWKGKFGIGGGTTSGLRAVNVGYVLGYRKFVMYGMDSCLAEDKDTKRFSGETVGNGMVIPVIVGGRTFYCNGALAQQANEFQTIYQAMPDVTIDCKGDGLIAWIISERKRSGKRT